MRLHTTCDCFISTSYGEAWCLPAFDAMGMGKTPICTNYGGPKQFLKDGGGILVDGRMEPVFGMQEKMLPHMFVGDECWTSIDVPRLRHFMRHIYEDKATRQKLAGEGIDNAMNYSYGKIGQLMKEILNG